jgi:hypothetical protein
MGVKLSLSSCSLEYPNTHSLKSLIHQIWSVYGAPNVNPIYKVHSSAQPMKRELLNMLYLKGLPSVNASAAKIFNTLVV